MKNRFLPLSLITAFFGLSLLLTTLFAVAGRPGNPDIRNAGGSWLESVRANQHTGMVNPMDVFNARQQAEALRVKSTSGAMGLNWLSVGPDNFPGLVWSVLFDNTDPSALTIIAGSGTGGIWKSIDLGLTWSLMPVENNLKPKFSSLVQTANGTIYAATGLNTCFVVQPNGLGGIFRSVNGGEFTRIPSTQNNADLASVTKLAIDPQSGRLFAATSSGLFYSDSGDEWVATKTGFAMDVCVGPDGTVLAAVGDSGYIAAGGDLNSWVTLTTGKPNTLPTSGIGWMVFAVSPSDGNVMYASLAATSGKLLGVYSSEDKGNNWSVVFPSNPSFEPFGAGGGCYANTLAVSPNDPYKVYLGGLNMWYGQKINSTGYYNWERISFGTYGALSPYFAPLYHHCYMFRPNNAAQLVMATDGGVSLATIGVDGVTYQTSNKELRTSQFTTLAFSAQKGYVMGGGNRIGTLAMGFFYPSQVSFPSNGYQVWRVDASSLGDNYQPQPSNYGGQGGTCEWSNIDSRLAVYSKKGESKIRRQDLTDINYYNLFSQGVSSDTNGHVPMRLWETFNQGAAFGITRDSVKYFADQFAIPADTVIMVSSSSNKFLFPYLTTAPIPKGDSITVADPIASRFFLCGDSLNNGNGIFMTMDFLKFNKVPEFFQIFKNDIILDKISAFAISADVNTAWAATISGRLIRISGLINAYDSATANIASSQCVLADSIFANTPFIGRSVTSISIDPNNSNHVLITLGNYGNDDYVYYTQNGNDPVPTFTSIQGNLPKAPVYSGLLEMHGSNAVLGTDLGVFSTTDVNAGVPQWTGDMQNVGDIAAMDVRQQVIRDYHIQNYGVIYLASYGRGVWMDTTYASPVGIDPVRGEIRKSGDLKLNPNPVRDNLNITYMNEQPGNLSLTVYDLSGRILMSTSLGSQPKGRYKGTVNLGSLVQGTYIVKIGTGYGKVVKL